MLQGLCGYNLHAWTINKQRESNGARTDVTRMHEYHSMKSYTKQQWYYDLIRIIINLYHAFAPHTHPQTCIHQLQTERNHPPTLNWPKSSTNFKLTKTWENLTVNLKMNCTNPCAWQQTSRYYIADRQDLPLCNTHNRVGRSQEQWWWGRQNYMVYYQTFFVDLTWLSGNFSLAFLQPMDRAHAAGKPYVELEVTPAVCNCQIYPNTLQTALFWAKMTWTGLLCSILFAAVEWGNIAARKAKSPSGWKQSGGGLGARLAGIHSFSVGLIFLLGHFFEAI